VLLINDKLHSIYEQVNDVGIGINVNWGGSELRCNYYDYFNDPNVKIRAGALFAFNYMLMGWFEQSSFPFTPDTGKTFEDGCYRLEDFLQVFLEYKNEIEVEFPFLFASISYYLYEIDKVKEFEKRLPHVAPSLFCKMRNSLFAKKKLISIPFKSVYDESRLPPTHWWTYQDEK